MIGRYTTGATNQGMNNLLINLSIQKLPERPRPARNRKIVEKMTAATGDAAAVEDVQKSLGLMAMALLCAMDSTWRRISATFSRSSPVSAAISASVRSCSMS